MALRAATFRELFTRPHLLVLAQRLVRHKEVELQLVGQPSSRRALRLRRLLGLQPSNTRANNVGDRLAASWRSCKLQRPAEWRQARTAAQQQLVHHKHAHEAEQHGQPSLAMSKESQQWGRQHVQRSKPRPPTEIEPPRLTR